MKWAIHSSGVCMHSTESFTKLHRQKHSQGPNWKNHLDRFESQRKESLFCNVYAPSDLRQHQEFIHSLNTYLMFLKHQI